MKLYARTCKPVKEAAIERLRLSIGHTSEHTETDTLQNETQAI